MPLPSGLYSGFTEVFDNRNVLKFLERRAAQDAAIQEENDKHIKDSLSKIDSSHIDYSDQPMYIDMYNKLVEFGKGAKTVEGRTKFNEEVEKAKMFINESRDKKEFRKKWLEINSDVNKSSQLTNEYRERVENYLKSIGSKDRTVTSMSFDGMFYDENFNPNEETEKYLKDSGVNKSVRIPKVLSKIEGAGKGTIKEITGVFSPNGEGDDQNYWKNLASEFAANISANPQQLKQWEQYLEKITKATPNNEVGVQQYLKYNDVFQDMIQDDFKGTYISRSTKKDYKEFKVPLSSMMPNITTGAQLAAAFMYKKLKESPTVSEKPVSTPSVRVSVGGGGKNDKEGLTEYFRRLGEKTPEGVKVLVKNIDNRYLLYIDNERDKAPLTPFKDSVTGEGYYIFTNTHVIGESGKRDNNAIDQHYNNDVFSRSAATGASPPRSESPKNKKSWKERLGERNKEDGGGKSLKAEDWLPKK